VGQNEGHEDHETHENSLVFAGCLRAFRVLRGFVPRRRRCGSCWP